MPPSNVLQPVANLWPREIESPCGRTVHVWSGSLDRSEADCRQFAAFLDAQELQRAARFRFPLHRSRFIAGRGLLRSILAQYIQCEPGSIAFEYSRYGKPHLKQCALHFNLAHSENRCVLALCESPVGVDIELRRAIPDLDSLATQVFSPAELELWKAARTLDAFLHLWTRKEALLKGIGLGIANHVKDVSVFFETDVEIKIPRTLTPDRWTVQTFAAENEIWSLALPFRPLLPGANLLPDSPGDDAPISLFARRSDSSCLG